MFKKKVAASSGFLNSKVTILFREFTNLFVSQKDLKTKMGRQKIGISSAISNREMHGGGESGWPTGRKGGKGNYFCTLNIKKRIFLFYT